jgi:hypothetical protein
MWNTASSSWISAAATVLVAALALAIGARSSSGDGNGEDSPRRHGGTEAESSSSLAFDVRPVVGLVPSEDPAITKAIADGARRVFDEARRDGGPELTLVVGAGAGKWDGAGAETVRFACDERVVALIGPPERTLAHPAAQAATRCRVPLFSTSPAASVGAAGSRWVFAVVTSDGRATLTAAEAEAAGRDAAHAVVGAVRRAGLSRDAFPAAAATEITPEKSAPR